MENANQTGPFPQTWEGRIAHIKQGAEALRKTQDGLVRAARNAFKAASVFDLPALRRHLAAARALIDTYTEQAAAWDESVSGFELGSVAEEEYARAFEEACLKADVRVEGRFPVYEVFPLEIRISLADEQALINNRVCRTMEPTALAAAIRKELDRLARSRFNEGQFMAALVRAYDLLVAESRATRGRPVRQVRLKQIYKALTMLRGRPQYPERLFAYDIYRLRESSDLTYSGRRLVFGHVRVSSSAIAVPSHAGMDYLGYLELEEVEGT